MRLPIVPLLLLLPLLPTRAAQPSAPPNLIVFLADDLGWGDLGVQGHPIIKTPHLDAFAKQGVRLTQCYSASAVCSPSRSAILTGRTPHRNGVYTWIQERSEVHLRTSEITLPRLLKSAGYATAHSGKWHLNGLFNNPAQPQPSDHGYDWWLATQNNAGPSHENPSNFVRNGQPLSRLEGYAAPLVVDEAVVQDGQVLDLSHLPLPAHATEALVYVRCDGEAIVRMSDATATIARDGVLHGKGAVQSLRIEAKGAAAYVVIATGRKGA